MLAERQVLGADPKWAWLLGLFVLALILRVACFTGLIASDDLGYAMFAQRVADGTYAPYPHHYAVRFGLFVPVGLLYGVAGVSEWSTIAVPLVASSLSPVLLALIGRRLFDFRVGLIAGLLLATFPLELRYATILLPEAVAGFYALLAVYAYVSAQERAPFALGALAGACVGLAYLTKEPAVFIGPALFLDAVLRRRWRLAFGVAAGLSAIIALEYAYYLAATGDLLFRFQSVAHHNRVNAPQPGNPVVFSYRLLQAYPRMMLQPSIHFGLHSLAAIALSAAALWSLRRDRRAYLLLMWAALPWLYLNFGSSSLTRYIPVPVAPRYISLAYPAAFLLSAWLLAELASRSARAKQTVLSLAALVLVAGPVCAELTRATGYNTGYVAVLRATVRQIGHEAPACVRFDFDAGRMTDRLKIYWGQTLYILSHGRIRECAGAADGFAIGRDRLGLPYVIPGARRAD